MSNNFGTKQLALVYFSNMWIGSDCWWRSGNRSSIRCAILPKATSCAIRVCCRAMALHTSQLQCFAFLLEWYVDHRDSLATHWRNLLFEESICDCHMHTRHRHSRLTLVWFEGHWQTFECVRFKRGGESFTCFAAFLTFDQICLDSLTLFGRNNTELTNYLYITPLVIHIAFLHFCIARTKILSMA